ncbi:MAG TPA: hypothetical protein VMX16_10950 [Terriglobia bacterium]|nr:hypothetical protein [Terriglobia bacterium]
MPTSAVAALSSAPEDAGGDTGATEKAQAKPYQVKQLLGLAERYNLSLGGEE